MACWECLLLPQCVFTEPNSFLGRNGASLRNMCTTHLLLRTPKQTHTHIVSDSHRKHTTPPYTAAATTTTKQQIKPLVFGVWQWCKLECRQVTRLSSSSSMRYYLLCDWNEWKKGKKQASEGSVLWQAERMHGVLGMNGLVVFWRIVRGFAGTRKINECVRSTVWASLWGREWMKFTWISRLCRQDGFETTPSWLRDGEAINNNEWAHSWT